MRAKSVSVGPLTISVTRGVELLIVHAKPKPKCWPSHLRPHLHGGERADHLTIPLKPRRHGPNVGKYWVHLSYPDKHRVELGVIDPQEARKAALAFQQVLHDSFLDSLRPVSPRDLAEDGYELVFADHEVWRERLTGFVDSPRRHYRVNRRVLLEVAQELLVASPLLLEELDEYEVPPAYFQVSRTDEATSDLILYRFPVNEEGKTGWFALPSRWLNELNFMRIVESSFGASLLKALYVFARETQAECDLQKLPSELRREWFTH